MHPFLVNNEQKYYMDVKKVFFKLYLCTRLKSTTTTIILLPISIIYVKIKNKKIDS